MKENDKIGYVYLTTNLVNGKQYVGQHLHDVFDKGYKGSGTYILNAINKYGWDNFKCEVLQWCSTQTQLNEVEDNCIRLYGTMVPNGYNLKGGGANGRYSKEAKKNMSNAQKGRVVTEEQRTKISKTLKGRKRGSLSEQIRKNMSEAAKKRTKRCPMPKSTGGWKHTKEWSAKMSEKRKGHTVENETRKKLSEAQDKYKKKVRQYTLDGEFIKEWASLHEIKRELGFECSAISNCCKGKAKTAYKHLWKFAS